MASELISKLSAIDQLEARRAPDLRVLAQSNRQPVGALEIPMAQRRSIVTVGQASCRWPIGDPQQKDFYLCGACTNGHDTYCAHHMQTAYVPASRARRWV